MKVQNRFQNPREIISPKYSQRLFSSTSSLLSCDSLPCRVTSAQAQRSVNALLAAFFRGRGTDYGLRLSKGPRYVINLQRIVGKASTANSYITTGALVGVGRIATQSSSKMPGYYIENERDALRM